MPSTVVKAVTVPSVASCPKRHNEVAPTHCSLMNTGTEFGILPVVVSIVAESGMDHHDDSMPLQIEVCTRSSSFVSRFLYCWKRASSVNWEPAFSVSSSSVHE